MSPCRVSASLAESPQVKATKAKAKASDEMIRFMGQVYGLKK